MDPTEKKAYPPRLYEVGNYPSLNRSVNHGCSLESLMKAKPYLGDDVWEVLKKCRIGCIIRLAESKFIVNSKMIYYFLTHQLQIKKPMEMWCLIGDDPLRFSLHEFSQVTGLPCGAYDLQVEESVDNTELWEKMDVAIGDAPHWNDLERILPLCTDWSYEERRIVGSLCLLHIGIFGLQRGCRMELKHAKKALTLEAFDTFQWGRISFAKLISSIKDVNLAGSSVTLNGFVQALNIWAFESYEMLGKLYGRRKNVEGLPLFRWGGSRERYIMDEVIHKSKTANIPVCLC